MKRVAAVGGMWPWEGTRNGLLDRGRQWPLIEFPHSKQSPTLGPVAHRHLLIGFGVIVEET
eukprot:m.12064 g.12064  ORF g.12064 m.12064 type:complete len:61 (-) comp4511_c0_seq1:110-292(-)